MTVAILDYGMGNLGSVCRALEDSGARYELVSSPERLRIAERILLPGVGSFAEAMARLRELGLAEALVEAASEAKPILGICLGMQLLADGGEEGGESEGLGLVPGRIVRIHPRGRERVPHMGWNEAQQKGPPHPLFEGIASGTDFYFVHSFHFVPDCQEDVLAISDYAGGLVAAVARGTVAGVQFHPEKSSKPGRRLIANWLKD